MIATYLILRIDMNTMKEARRKGEIRSVVACGNAEDACPGFSSRAAEHILRYLKKQGISSGEDITDSCKDAGLVPHDDRAFGAVFSGLSRRKEIVFVGFGMRRKGHGTAGSRLWKLKA